MQSSVALVVQEEGIIAFGRAGEDEGNNGVKEDRIVAELQQFGCNLSNST